MAILKLSYGPTHIHLYKEGIMGQDYDRGEIGYSTNKSGAVPSISFYRKYTGRPLENLTGFALTDLRDADGLAFVDMSAFRNYWRTNFYSAPGSGGSVTSSPEDTAQEEYANNADAKANGLKNGDFYRTGDAVQVVHA